MEKDSKRVANFLQSGTKLHGKTYDYEILKVLGNGAFGITYLASFKVKADLGEIETFAAVKEFFMHEINGREQSSVTGGTLDGIYEKYKRQFIKESLNLSSLKHDNIIKVLESFEANNTVYYVMEYLSGGNLDKYIQSKGCLTEKEALKFALQIAEAMSFMHSKDMLHLDIKPSNIMMRDTEHLVLIDFGLSKQYNNKGVPESTTSIGMGTPGYAPLEQSNYNGHDPKNGLPVTMDVHALGGTIFKMLTGHTPPPASEILNEGFPTDELEALRISVETIKLVMDAMAPFKKQRIQSMDIMVQRIKAAMRSVKTGEAPEDKTNDESQVVVEYPKGQPTDNGQNQQTEYTKLVEQPLPPQPPQLVPNDDPTIIDNPTPTPPATDWKKVVMWVSGIISACAAVIATVVVWVLPQLGGSDYDKAYNLLIEDSHFDEGLALLDNLAAQGDSAALEMRASLYIRTKTGAGDRQDLQSVRRVAALHGLQLDSVQAHVLHERLVATKPGFNTYANMAEDYIFGIGCTADQVQARHYLDMAHGCAQEHWHIVRMDRLTAKFASVFGTNYEESK